MMKRNLLSVLVATAAVGFGGFAMNASASEGTGNADAVIVAPLTVTENTRMDFGDISPDQAVATTVVLDPSGGGVNSTDGAGLVPASGATEGIFDVAGEALAYDIDLLGGIATYSTTLTSGGGDTMTVDTFTLSKTSGVSANGDQFGVGATLHVGADQAPAADYTGTYTVTVTYQ